MLTNNKCQLVEHNLKPFFRFIVYLPCKPWPVIGLSTPIYRNSHKVAVWQVVLFQLVGVVRINLYVDAQHQGIEDTGHWEVKLCNIRNRDEVCTVKRKADECDRPRGNN